MMINSITFSTKFSKNCDVVENSNFKNANIMKYRTMSFFIFKNGQINVSGCKSLEDIPEIKKKIADILHTNEIPEHKINMISCRYNLKICIDLKQLFNDFLKIYKNVYYQPCKFHGLRVKTEQGNTYIIYRTGIIIITFKKVIDTIESDDIINYVKKKLQ